MELKPEQSLESELELARRCAEQGLVTVMTACLNLAEGYAMEAGVERPAEIKEIREFGYMQGVQFELGVAEKYAEKGNFLAMEVCLSLAERYAAKSGDDIKRQILDLKITGAANGIKAELVNAINYMGMEESERARACLMLVHLYTEKLRELYH